MAGNHIAILSGGAIEGAELTTRETLMWRPSMRSPDSAINAVKPLADARGRDSVRNDALIYGGVALHKDSVVGAQFRLNAAPNWKFLSAYSKGFDDAWAEEFQQQVETRFTLLAESREAWLDAQRINTLTGMVRLGVGVFLGTGEYLGTAEWLKDPLRPVQMAVQQVSSDRLCNPGGLSDTRFMRRGVERDVQGQPLAYHFRMGDPLDGYADNQDAYTWRRVPTRLPWMRKQVIHILEQMSPDQSRGISDMVAALKTMRMTRKFTEVTLQNAVINATYAAAIESELPNDAIAIAMGQGADQGAGLLGLYKSYMDSLGQYLDAANNIRIDGAQIPHLFPGTKLNMQPVKDTGGVGTDFESSLLRHIAAPLGLSYEEFSRDFSKTNYSSARAAIGVSGRAMASRKKHVADRLATEIYALVLEEFMGAGNVPLPAGIKREVFYRDAGLAKEAFITCKWIGSGTGQIDEMKETQAAILRIASGLSTYEDEIGRLGGDYREKFAQRKREQVMIDTLGLTFDLAAKKPLGQQPGATDVTTDTENAETEKVVA